MIDKYQVFAQRKGRPRIWDRSETLIGANIIPVQVAAATKQ